LYSNNRGTSNEIIMERNPSFQNKKTTTTSDIDVWGRQWRMHVATVWLQPWLESSSCKEEASIVCWMLLASS
jgi:hypothetical protein